MLDQQARRLGFADLRNCLHALVDDGWSVPQLAAHLATTQAAELGFASVRAYLVDRLVTKAWTLAEVAAELGTARGTLRRLLDQHQVRRAGLTRRQRAAAAAARGPKVQAWAVQQRCQARLAELGFAALEAYLQDRYVRRGWSGAAAVRRARHEPRLAGPAADPDRTAHLT